MRRKLFILTMMLAMLAIELPLAASASPASRDASLNAGGGMPQISLRFGGNRRRNRRFRNGFGNYGQFGLVNGRRYRRHGRW